MLEVEAVVVMKIDGPDGERRSAARDVINQWRVSRRRAKTNRQRYELRLQTAILN